MNKSSVLKHLDFLILDVIIFTLSFVLAYISYHGSFNQLLNNSDYKSLYFVLMLIRICLVYFVDPYSGILRRSWVMEIKEIVLFTLYSLLILSLYLFAIKIGSVYSRVTIGLTYLIYSLFGFAGRVLLKRIVRNNASDVNENQSKTKVLIITTEKELERVIKNIKKRNYDGMLVDSVCLIDKNIKPTLIDGFRVEHNKDTVLTYLCHNWIDMVLIATDSKKVPNEIYEGLSQAGITTSAIIPPIDGFENRKQSINKMFGYTVVSTSISPRTSRQIFLKRLIDIIGGIVGCVITLILALIIGPIIYTKSKGPIFYKQERIGQNGRRFKMYKFRSMVMNADDLKDELRSKNRIKDGMMFKVDNDPRIIPGIGEFIRKTSLDEFPQFINVLKGDMSLVGTRPPTVDEWIKYKLEHRIRMSIKPGITGLWQTNGRSKITDFNKVIEYDTEYINNWTLALDLEILFKTVLVLFSKREKDEAM